MSASVVEQILARVQVALLAAGISGLARVERARVDAFGAADLPALNIRRGGIDHERLGETGERLLVAFDLDHHVAVDDDWETAADALHMATHAALVADAPLAALGRGLRCTGTDMQGDSADRVIGLLTARYQLQVFVRPGDFTRAIS